MVVMDGIVCPSPFIYWSTNPSVIVFGDWVFKEVIEVKWGHECETWIQYDWCP